MDVNVAINAAVICVIAVGALALAAYIYAASRIERLELIEMLVHKDQDIYDRLMAKSLTEVKSAQREPETGVVTSKRRNDERITRDHVKIAQE